MAQFLKLTPAGLAIVAVAFFCAPAAVLAQSAVTAPQLADKSPAAELAFWNSIKDSSNSADFKTYLMNFPNGMFYDPAIERFEQTGGSKGDLPAAAQPASNTVNTPVAAKSLAIAKPNKAATIGTTKVNTKSKTKTVSSNGAKKKTKTVTIKKKPATTTAAKAKKKKPVCNSGTTQSGSCAAANKPKLNLGSGGDTHSRGGSGGGGGGSGGGHGWGG